ncbi:unnamed protein product [Calypogeia fissa]
MDFGVGAKAGAAEEEEFRVAVVGGGLAGISAARLLSSRFGKENVVILEAASCLGGRIRNVHGLAPWPVEIGAEFLHGSQKSSVKTIVDEMGFLDRISPDYYYIGQERRLLSSEEADEHPDVQLVHEIFSALRENVSKIPDISMAEYLRLKGVNHTVVQLAEAIYGNDFGCSLDKLGVHECIQEAQHWTYGDRYLILDRPLLSVVAYMSKDLSVRCNWVVNEVERLPNSKLQLHGQDGKLVKADNVILTVPVTILQHDAITFSPALPDWKRQAARAIGMSNVVKVIFAFCHSFWPEGLFDVVCLGCFLPEVWITEYPRPQGTEKEIAANSSPQQPLGQHVVVGFVAGNAADALSQLPEADVFMRGLAQLDEIFGKREVCGISQGSVEGTSSSIDVPRGPPEENLRSKEHNGVDHHGPRDSLQLMGSEKFVTKSDLLKNSSWSLDAQSCHTNPASFHFQGGMIVNWAEQSFIRGGYSYPSVNALGARDALARPVDRIFFAGEATHHGVNPCLQAAIDTGQRAAYQNETHRSHNGHGKGYEDGAAAKAILAPSEPSVQQHRRGRVPEMTYPVELTQQVGKEVPSFSRHLAGSSADQA